MPAAEFLRLKAQECRELIAKAIKPEVIAQLELWAREFEEEAARMESTAEAPTVLVIAPTLSTKGSC